MAVISHDLASETSIIRIRLAGQIIATSGARAQIFSPDSISGLLFVRDRSDRLCR